MTNVKNPNVALYIRTSTNEEAEGQKASLLEYCNKHNLPVNEKNICIDIKNQSMSKKLLPNIKRMYRMLLTRHLRRIFRGVINK
jgi:DNA invertase Pin-like site-specific DNA recombinase